MRCTFFVDVASAVLHWHDRIGTGLARHISDLLLGGGEVCTSSPAVPSCNGRSAQCGVAVIYVVTDK